MQIELVSRFLYAITVAFMILHRCVTTQGHMSHQAVERAQIVGNLLNGTLFALTGSGPSRQGPGMLLSSCERDTLSEDLPEREKERGWHMLRTSKEDAMHLTQTDKGESVLGEIRALERSCSSSVRHQVAHWFWAYHVASPGASSSYGALKCAIVNKDCVCLCVRICESIFPKYLSRILTWARENLLNIWEKSNH